MRGVMDRDHSTNRIAAAVRRMPPGWRFARFGVRRVALRGALRFTLLRHALRLLCPHLLHLRFTLLHLLFTCALHVLHLHLALLLGLLLLLALLLLHLLLACALLVAHLRFALLLELLLAGALLVGLCRTLALLLRLLFWLLADALPGFDGCLLLALSGAFIERLRRALDGPHDRQPSLRGGGRFAGGPDDGRARQGAGFAGVRKTCAGQFVRARGHGRHGSDRSLDRADRALVRRFVRRYASGQRFRGALHRARPGRRHARGGFGGTRRHRTAAHGAVRRAGKGRNQFHALVARFVGRLGAAQIAHLGRGQGPTLLTGDDLLACGEIDRPRRRLVARDHRPSERLAAGDRTCGGAFQTPAGRARIGVGPHRDLGALELGTVQPEHRRVHGARIGEHVARHRGHGARHAAVGVVAAAARRHAARTIVAVEGVDDRLVDVDVADVGDVDVGEVTLRRVEPRHVHVARTEREPAHRTAAAEANRYRQPGSADEGHQWRRIHRAHVDRPRHPAPAVPGVYPAAVMEGREAPGLVIHPGPAPRIDPRPVAVAIRRPAGRHRGRVPDVAVLRHGVPLAVLVEVVAADHVGRDVLLLLLRVALVVGVAGFAETIEVVGLRQAGFVDAGQLRIVETIRGSFHDFAAGAVLAVHRAGAAEHGHHAAGAAGVVVDAIDAGCRGHECDGGSIHLEILAVAQLAHREVERALREFDLDVVFVEVEEVERAVVVDADRGIAEFQYGAAVVAGQQAIADHHRPVDLDRAPVVVAGGRELHLAGKIGQPRHPAGRLRRVDVGLGGVVGGLVLLGHGWQRHDQQRAAESASRQHRTQEMETGHGRSPVVPGASRKHRSGAPRPTH